MLAPSHRLTRSADFTRAVRGGRRAGRGRLVVHLLLTGEEGPVRCGFVASKAVGSAVVRNTVKRRLRHLMREKMPLLPDGSLVVVRALPSSSAADSRALGGDLDRALRRVLGGDAR
jgi:ribonuclease P protein component